MIYLDNAATTKPDTHILEAYAKLSEDMFYNSESLHGGGLDANSLLEQARNYIKNYFDSSKQVIFTRSGSHANEIAIQLLLKERRPGCILVSPYEHLSIEAALEPYNDIYSLTMMPLDRDGHIDLDRLEKMMEGYVALVIMQHVNSETGYRLPVEDVGEMCVARNVPLHTDGVQGAHKDEVGIDRIPGSYSFSSHKIHGTKGTGVLMVDYRYMNVINSHFHHESGTQNGTLNVPAIGVMTMCLSSAPCIERMQNVRQYLKEKMESIGVITLDFDANAPHILACITPSIEGQYVMQGLSSKNIYVSTGTACGQGRMISSGLEELLGGRYETSENHYIRISISKNTTRDEIDTLASHMDHILQEVRQ
ncbi:cysteine desulfurase family protein [Salinicoccus carnicancri]|uniref:cysteine desulfurase family protein n=1 Tax=Salinicoccus carnicancri TaxID=558170 RepID=UPI0002E3525D|nr:aminotransferase class V-fold PLP-dependent enzyme [Salinicoccus carnicancri]